MKKLILIGIFLALLAAPAMADLQSVLDSITLAPNPGVSSVNVATDTIPDGQDAYWQLNASGGSVATIIAKLGSFTPASKFGVFDMTNSATSVQLFGPTSVAGDQAVLSIKVDGSVFVNLVDTGVDFSGNAFGYYLDATIGNQNQDAIFYSDTALNADDVDHMFAEDGLGIDTVQLPNLSSGIWDTDEYVLGWEDTYGGGNLDYDDFVVMVESVQPVPGIPAPGAILLGGIGVMFVGWIRRRRIL